MNISNEEKKDYFSEDNITSEPAGEQGYTGPAQPQPEETRDSILVQPALQEQPAQQDLTAQPEQATQPEQPAQQGQPVLQNQPAQQEQPQMPVYTAPPPEPPQAQIPYYPAQPHYPQHPAYAMPPEQGYENAAVYAMPPEQEHPASPYYNAQASAAFPQYPPVNNQAYSSWNMYSPGICAEQPSQKSSRGDATQQKTPRKGKFRIGAFLRAACLVAVCAAFSAGAAALVIDYHLDRLAGANQTISGGNIPDYRQIEEIRPLPAPSLPSLSNGTAGALTGQEIYDIALTQVVAIATGMPDSAQRSDSGADTSSVVGSGFIISDDGYILTNYHVIEMSHRANLPITVILSDDSTYDATVIGFEANCDVAVIKIDAKGLNPGVMGDSGSLRVGQTIYAVGNPFGDLVYTMTDGIVSAIDRIVSVEGKTINTFQFSAAVNSGNSGGPIYNTDGQIIGIVTAKVSRGNVDGIGFAIPINEALDIALPIIEHGYISGRPLLGVVIQPLSQAQADYFGWVVGTYVRSVNPGSAAEKAGILVGDIITAIGGEDTDSTEALRFALRQFNAGDTTSITVWRNGEYIDLTITFDEDMNAGRPETVPVPTPDSPDPFDIFP